jgi:hypothetical protein
MRLKMNFLASSQFEKEKKNYTKKN